VRLAICTIITDHFNDPGKAFGRVCVSVCASDSNSWKLVYLDLSWPDSGQSRRLTALLRWSVRPRARAFLCRMLIICLVELSETTFWCCTPPVRTVVRVAEGLRTTETGRPTREAAAEADQVQAAAVRREVATGQDADQWRHRRWPHRRRRHCRTFNGGWIVRVTHLISPRLT